MQKGSLKMRGLMLMMMMMISLAKQDYDSSSSSGTTTPPGTGNIFHQLPSSLALVGGGDLLQHRQTSKSANEKMRHQHAEEGKVEAFFKCFQCRLSSFAGLHPGDICPYPTPPTQSLPLLRVRAADFSRAFGTCSLSTRWFGDASI